MDRQPPFMSQNEKTAMKIVHHAQHSAKPNFLQYFCLLVEVEAPKQAFVLLGDMMTDKYKLPDLKHHLLPENVTE